MKLNGYKTPLHERFALVQLNCSFSWGTVTDTAISNEVNTSKQSHNALRVRKTLMPEASGTRIKALSASLNDFYAWHKLNTMSTPTKGQRVFPVPLYMLYTEKFADAKAKSDEALEELIAHYDDDVRAAQQLLQGAFKPEDYPEADEIRRFYAMNARFLPMPAGNQILNVLGQDVAADVDLYVQNLAQTALADAKSKFKEVVARMAERLANPTAVFRDSLTQNIDDMLNVLPMMNITDDPAFDQLIVDARQTIQGYDPEQLRANKLVRSQVATAALDILKRL